jgi:sensor histidine kinase regulating citrate/malate metabolism
MCLPFLKDKAESFSDTIVKNTPNGLIVLNENLEVQQINDAARRIMNIRAASDVLGEPVIRILDPTVFAQVKASGRSVRNKRTYLAEYGVYVDQTALYNSEYHLFICILRDVTEEMRQQGKKLEMQLQAVDIANDVAKKQLKIVQEIASLLGETAADTLIAIDRLKETISDD